MDRSDDNDEDDVKFVSNKVPIIAIQGVYSDDKEELYFDGLSV